MRLLSEKCKILEKAAKALPCGFAGSGIKKLQNAQRGKRKIRKSKKKFKITLTDGLCLFIIKTPIETVKI